MAGFLAGFVKETIVLLAVLACHSKFLVNTLLSLNIPSGYALNRIGRWIADVFTDTVHFQTRSIEVFLLYLMLSHGLAESRLMATKIQTEPLSNLDIESLKQALIMEVLQVQFVLHAPVYNPHTKSSLSQKIDSSEFASYLSFSSIVPRTLHH